MSPFFPLFRVALYAHIYVQPSSHRALLDLCDSIFADCMQMLRISQSNAFVLKRFIRYLHNLMQSTRINAHIGWVGVCVCGGGGVLHLKGPVCKI